MDGLRAVLDAAGIQEPKFAATPGLTRAVVELISQQKQEPAWMLEKRLAALALFAQAPLPTWGADLSALHFEELTYFVRPDAREETAWDDVPAEIRETFDRLGIPKAEQEALAGVGAQYDSDIVYHHLKEEWAKKGVIFLNMDAAVHEQPELVREHFMTSCVPIHDHKFAMLHAAVWSGGTFIYVPPGVEVEIPLQAYFRMNYPGGGQFEHTLIVAGQGAKVHYIEGCSAPRYDRAALHAGCVEIFVGKNAEVTYSSLENWSRNTYNLNTKRALVDAGGSIRWLNGNMGSCTTMLYPMSVLRGRGATSDYLGVAVAGPGQVQDTGHKVSLVAPETRANVRAKSIAFGGGVSVYRGLVKATPGAVGATVHVQCDGIMMDAQSKTSAIPTMDIAAPNATVAHEASVGRLSDAARRYLESRGCTPVAATRAMVAGFLEPVTRALPLEYAAEFLRLMELELERIG